MKILRLLLRLLLGAFFIFSAVSKFSGIESFEIYLYSSSFLSYDLATILARLVIAIELLIGVSLITRLAFVPMWRLAIFFTAILTLFLVWQFMQGSDENCHCLGELVELSPGMSILKNLLLIVLLLLIRKSANLKLQRSQLVFGVVVIACIATPLIISPPDILVKGSYNPATHDQEALDEAVQNEIIPNSYIEGKKLVAFYSPGCKFCKMASTRVGEMLERNKIAAHQVRIVFWADSTLNAQPFFEDTNSPELTFTTLDTEPYLEITKGRMPLLLLIEDGQVKDQMNYRTLDESRIAGFLGSEM